MPLQLFDLIAAGTWNDPAVLPSARAREFLKERVRKMEDQKIIGGRW